MQHKGANHCLDISQMDGVSIRCLVQVHRRHRPSELNMDIAGNPAGLAEIFVQQRRTTLAITGKITQPPPFLTVVMRTHPHPLHSFYLCWLVEYLCWLVERVVEWMEYTKPNTGTEIAVGLLVVGCWWLWTGRAATPIRICGYPEQLSSFSASFSPPRRRPPW